MSSKSNSYRFAKLFTIAHPQHGVIHMIFRRWTGKLLHGCYTDLDGNNRPITSVDDAQALLDELEAKVAHV